MVNFPELVSLLMAESRRRNAYFNLIKFPATLGPSEILITIPDYINLYHARLGTSRFNAAPNPLPGPGWERARTGGKFSGRQTAVEFFLIKPPGESQ